MDALSKYPTYLKVSVNSHLKNFLDSSSREIVLSQATTIDQVLKSPSRDKRWSFYIDKDSPITFREIVIGKKSSRLIIIVI